MSTDQKTFTRGDAAVIGATVGALGSITFVLYLIGYWPALKWFLVVVGSLTAIVVCQQFAILLHRVFTSRRRS